MSHFTRKALVKGRSAPSTAGLVRTVCTVRRVDEVDTETLKKKWRTYKDAVMGLAPGSETGATPTLYAITHRGRPMAVLMSMDAWRALDAAAPVPAHKRITMAAAQVRDGFRARRDAAANRGVHTLVSMYGSLHTADGVEDDETVDVVIAPYAWTLTAQKAQAGPPAAADETTDA